jgi:actin related protein 2/3 complex subunit 2
VGYVTSCTRETLTDFNCHAESRSSLIYHLSMLKPMIFSAPFRLAYESHKQLAAAHSPDTPSAEVKQGELMIINYREEEAFFVQSSWDRITVYISTAFKEETDRVFGRVFLQVSALKVKARINA